jgi:hypothetical protein
MYRGRSRPRFCLGSAVDSAPCVRTTTPIRTSLRLPAPYQTKEKILRLVEVPTRVSCHWHQCSDAMTEAIQVRLLDRTESKDLSLPGSRSVMASSIGLASEVGEERKHDQSPHCPIGESHLCQSPHDNQCKYKGLDYVYRTPIEQGGSYAFLLRVKMFTTCSLPSPTRGNCVFSSLQQGQPPNT